MRETKSFDPSLTFVYGRTPRPRARVRFVGVLRPEPPGAGPPFELDGPEVVIGRQEGIGVHLDDDTVSRRHARILRSGDEFILEDMGSSNGTYVDGVPVVSCVLRPGDTIQIGRIVFEFEVRLAPGTGLEGFNPWVE